MILVWQVRPRRSSSNSSLTILSGRACRAGGLRLRTLFVLDFLFRSVVRMNPFSKPLLQPVLPIDDNAMSLEFALLASTLASALATITSCSIRPTDWLFHKVHRIGRECVGERDLLPAPNSVVNGLYVVIVEAPATFVISVRIVRLNRRITRRTPFPFARPGFGTIPRLQRLRGRLLEGWRRRYS